MVDLVGVACVAGSFLVARIGFKKNLFKLFSVYK